MYYRRGIQGNSKFSYCLFFLIVTIPCILFSQTDDITAVEGRIIDQETQAPVPNVNIIIVGTNLGTTSDSDGYFRISNIPSGSQRLQFSHINYIAYSYTQFFAPGIIENITIELIGRPILLEEIEVVDTLPRRVATGYFYSRQDIENTAAITFGQVIQALVPRARVHESAGNLFIQLQLRQSIYQRHERMRDPYPLIIVNGMKLGTSPVGLAGVAPASQIDNMTVIRPPESQSIYGPEGAHGVIIIETRQDKAEESLLTSRQLNMIVGGLVAFMLAMIFLW